MVPKPKFTPGPWHEKENGRFRAICRQDGFVIARVMSWPSDIEDARLIATAPDLYEALKAIAEREQERIDRDRRINPNGLTEASILIIAKEALAKAEGR